MEKEKSTQLSTWERILLARHQDRPYTLDYIQGMIY